MMTSILNLDINKDPDSSDSVTSSKSFENNYEINSPFAKKSTSSPSSLRFPIIYLLFIGDHDVIYTDFIGERIGSIRDYYSLLSPPIGKG